MLPHESYRSFPVHFFSCLEYTVIVIYSSPCLTLLNLLSFNPEWQIWKPGPTEVKSPHSGHRASTYQIWDSNPGFLTSLTVHLTTQTTPSSRGQQAFSPRQTPNSKHQKPEGLSFPCPESSNGASTAHWQQPGFPACHPQLLASFCCSLKSCVLLRFFCSSMHSSACSPGLKLFSLSNAPTAIHAC